jgi:hypothetical protein
MMSTLGATPMENPALVVAQATNKKYQGIPKLRQWPLGRRRA